MSIRIIPSGGQVPVGTTGGATGITPPITPGGGGGVPTFPTITTMPQQIAGFIPLKQCTDTECRNVDIFCNYINPVFGEINNHTSGYQNDVNSFFISVELAKSLANQQVEFVLQRCSTDNKTWANVAVMNSTYGIIYKLGSIKGHATYCGITISWGLVLALHGPGTYRVMVQDDSITSVSTYYSYFEFPTNNIFLFDANITIRNNEGGSFNIPTFGQVLTHAQIIQILNTNASSIANKLTYSIVSPAAPGQNEQIQCKSGSGFGPSTFGIDFDSVALIKKGTSVSTVNTSTTNCFLVSEPFELKAWDCTKAHGTVKFEATLTGKIGDIAEDYLVYDLSGITIYDSIRLKGFFGYKTVPKYLEVTLEWGQPTLGKIERVRDEAIQQYQFFSNLLPKYIHDRLSVYGLMADKLLASDYNLNNSDYDIKQVNVVKAGAYEPEYYDDKSWRRQGKVKVLFNRGVQAVFKSLC